MAAGLDSTILGEDQVLHQFREALAAARTRGPLPPEIERLCQVALRAGRQARAWRTGPPRSLADAALDRLQEVIGPLDGRHVLVVGAGEMGRLLAGGAAGRGAHVAIASRHRDRAESAARALGAVPVPFVDAGEIETADGIAIALRGRWPVEGAARAALLGRRTALVDLSEPSALDAALRSALGAACATLDELTSAEDDVPDGRLRRRLQTVVDQAAGEYLAWLEARASADTIRAIVDAGESRRREAMQRLLRRLPDLDPPAQEAIEQMSQQLVAGILHEPVERLRRDDGSRSAAARDLFGL